MVNTIRQITKQVIQDTTTRVQQSELGVTVKKAFPCLFQGMGIKNISYYHVAQGVGVISLSLISRVTANVTNGATNFTAVTNDTATVEPDDVGSKERLSLYALYIVIFSAVGVVVAFNYYIGKYCKNARDSANNKHDVDMRRTTTATVPILDDRED